jgi:hypothetical protein
MLAGIRQSVPAGQVVAELHSPVAVALLQLVLPQTPARQ